MCIEQIDINDIKIRSKYLDLRLRPESIIVTRMFSENLNLPFVVFIIQDDNIVLVPPTKIKIKGNTVFFDAENLSGSISLQVDSLLFQAQAHGHRVGLMWPNSGSSCYFADELCPINRNFTTTGKFMEPGDDPTSIDISAPIVHMVDKACITIGSELLEPIKFCFFYHNRTPYWNAITNDTLLISFRSYPSKRDGLSAYYAKHGKSEQPAISSGHLGIEQMKRSLYSNRFIIIPYTPINLEQPKQIQEILDGQKIKNCIIGSLAMHIHGFPVHVQDFDIVVDNLENIQGVVQTSKSQKWSQCGARLKLDGMHVDFVMLPRFDWEQVEKIQGLNVLNMAGLLLMKLTGEYERSQMEPNYNTFKLKNCANIDLLLQKSPFVYPFFDNFLKRHSVENYMSLQDRIRGAVWDSVPMKINEPLIANVFSKNQATLLPIINNGSETPAKIRIERHIRDAQWWTIGQQQPVCCEIETHASWSDIIIPKVELLGVLECKNA